MNLRRVGILAPCEALNDFPTYHVGADAAGLLACWTAAWRPALIAQTGDLPRVVSTYETPRDANGEPDLWADGLLLVPFASVATSNEWLDAVRAMTTQSAATQAAATQGATVIEGFATRDEIISAISQATSDLPVVTPELEAEFFALAYAYLQVSALSHDLLYGSVFDSALFLRSVVAAAQAAVANDSAAIHDGLRICYDQLEQARTHSYPMDIHLVEVLLVAETTLGARLRRAVQEAQSTNLLLPGNIADRMTEREAQSIAALRTAVDEGRICLMTGGYDGSDVSTRAPEAMHREIARSVATLEQTIGSRPCYFAQHATSAPPRAPQLLAQLGFEGALLAGFDGADPLPLDLGRTTWVGLDGTSLESITGAPSDLARPETFLGLNEALALTLQRDHVATVILAGWPGHEHEAADDLRLVARRSDVLGRFVTLKDYFERAAISDHWSAVDNHSLGPPRSAPLPAHETPPATAEHAQLLEGLSEVAAALSNSAKSDHSQDPVMRLMDAISGTNRLKTDVTAARGVAAFNPWSCSAPAPATPAATIPSLGYWIGGVSDIDPTPPRAEEFRLRGENLLAQVHPESGGLQSLRTHSGRRNRVSQRLFVLGRRGIEVAQMRAEGVEPLDHGPHVGAIRSHGQLVTQGGAALAKFKQTMSLTAGADYLRVEARVEPTSNWSADQRIISRLNVGPGEWRLHRGLQWTRLPVSRTRFVAGDYAEWQDATGRVAIGFEYPVRCERRGAGLLDIVLPCVAGSPLLHRFALSLDNRYPLRTALGGLTSPSIVEAMPASDAGDSGWWLHCDAANVIVSSLGAAPVEAGAPARALRVRLIETEGRSAAARLRLCRPIQSAFCCDFDGPRREEQAVEQGAAVVEIGPYGWLEVEVTW